MKRYLMFGSDECYYASGGWNDFVDSFDTIEEVVAYWSKWSAREYNRPFGDKTLVWYHCVDTDISEVVRASKSRPFGSWEEGQDIPIDDYNKDNI